MKVVIITCVYPPEPVVSSQTSHQIAEELAQRGHEVTVIAPFPNRPAGKLYSGYTRKLGFQRTRGINGINLVRCASFLSPRSTMISRLLENISFGLTSNIAVLFLPKADVIYSNSWPLLATGLTALIAKLYDSSLIISVQDVYPESLLSQHRALINRWFISVLSKLDRFVAHNSKALVVISDYFKEIYRNTRQVEERKIHIIPNWIQEAEPKSTNNARNYRSDHSISNSSFVIAYGGNIGVAAGVETVIDSYRYFNGVRPYTIIAGQGSCLPICQTLVRELNDDRIIIHTPWHSEDTNYVLEAANILILPTRGAQSMVSVPSKLLSYMLAGKPVIALALPHSEVARIIEKSNCGWIVSPDRPDILAEHIKMIMTLPDSELKKRGQQGLEYVQQNLTDKICLPRIIEIIENAAKH